MVIAHVVSVASPAEHDAETLPAGVGKVTRRAGDDPGEDPGCGRVPCCGGPEPGGVVTVRCAASRCATCACVSGAVLPPNRSVPSMLIATAAPAAASAAPASQVTAQAIRFLITPLCRVAGAAGLTNS